MIKSLKKVYALLDRKQKKRFQLTWVLMLITSIVQVFGIVSIVPFITVAGNPETIQTNKYLKWTYDYFGFTSDIRFLIALGTFFLIFMLVSNLTIAFTRWVEMRFVKGVSTDLQTMLFQKYLEKPYHFYLTRNTAKLTKTLLGETAQVTNGVLIPGMEMLNQTFIAVVLILLLLVANPIIALIAVGVMGGLYGIIYYFIKKKLRVYGKQRVHANGQRFKAAQEGLAGIKEIKVFGREANFLNHFSKYAYKVMDISERSRLLQMVPPVFMELIAFGGVMALVLYLLVVKGSLGDALPMITLYAMAAYKLKPALQGAFSKSATIRFNTAALDAVYNDLIDYEAESAAFATEEDRRTKMPLTDKIEIRNLTFTYPKSPAPVIDNQNVVIPARSTVAFVGPTGSGKTTSVDILLGLLKPEEGQILIDGVKISGENLREWQNNIGYIPQFIYLSHNDVRSNIAFGISDKDIDDEAVIRAAKVANLHDFVMELPQGYKTTVGERGVRLSGGQRQRIGIARALYHNPEVLVMDEATSALDNLTEAAVMDAIQNLSGEKTLIMIAHRLSTVRNADCIYYLNRGKIEAQGTYDELLKSHTAFKELAVNG